jgi:hypothetical protein
MDLFLGFRVKVNKKERRVIMSKYPRRDDKYCCPGCGNTNIKNLICLDGDHSVRYKDQEEIGCVILYVCLLCSCVQAVNDRIGHKQREHLEEHKTHKLKCWPEYFKDLSSGSKTFDIRYNDRNFQVGDLIDMCEFSPAKEEYTGESLTFKISYKLDGGKWGLKQDFCCLGLECL